MIRIILAAFRKPAPQSAQTEAMIRSRGLSVCNRNRKQTAIYIATNTSLIQHKDN